MYHTNYSKPIAFYLLFVVVGFWCSSCEEGWMPPPDSDNDGPPPVATGDDPHMMMTEMRPQTSGDSVKAYVILEELELAIRKYQNIEVAKAEGYTEFPGASLVEEIHYINPLRTHAEADGINPDEPGALLYERQDDGSMKLVGGMFTAPFATSEEELDARFPLSFVRWHAHINICTPDPITDVGRWLELDENLWPKFGSVGSITTREACEAEGGEFHEQMFGWMMHIYPYKDDVWGMNHHGGGGHGDDHGDEGHGSGHGG